MSINKENIFLINKNWYKEAIFGTNPFSIHDLSEKTKMSPWGVAGGDSHSGILEPSELGDNTHPNNSLPAGRYQGTIEKKLEELKDRKKRKLRLKKKAQFGENSDKLPYPQTLPSGEKDWTSRTFNQLKPPHSKPVDNKQLKQSLKTIMNATVTIEVGDKNNAELGTGFFIAPNVILTCAHVFTEGQKTSKPEASIIIKTTKGEYNGALYAIDPNIDVAVMAVADPNYSNDIYLLLGKSGKIEIGDEVIVVGSPLGFENVVGTGIVSSQPTNFDMDPNGPHNIIFISVNLSPGNSGGPVVRQHDDHVIGIAANIVTQNASDSIGSLNGIIPIDLIKPFLKKNGIKWRQ